MKVICNHARKCKNKGCLHTKRHSSDSRGMCEVVACRGRGHGGRCIPTFLAELAGVSGTLTGKIDGQKLLKKYPMFLEKKREPVYCQDCKCFIGEIKEYAVVERCAAPQNGRPTYYSPTGCFLQPSEINKNNNCEWFQPKDPSKETDQ